MPPTPASSSRPKVLLLPPLIKAGLPVWSLSSRWVREAPGGTHSVATAPGKRLGSHCGCCGAENLGHRKETQEAQLSLGQKASGTFYSLAPQVTPLQDRGLGVLIRGKRLRLPLNGLLRGPRAAGGLLMLIARGIGSLWFKMIFSSFWVELGCWKARFLSTLNIAKQYLETEFLALDALDRSMEINGSRKIYQVLPDI